MKKQITCVVIEPGCISCGTCAVVCPAVFEVRGVSSVKQGADIVANAEAVAQAAEMCPVSVIKLISTSVEQCNE
jgi:ferredoxin